MHFFIPTPAGPVLWSVIGGDAPVVKPTKRRFMTPEECEEYGVPLGTEGPVDAGPDYAAGYLPDSEDRCSGA